MGKMIKVDKAGKIQLPQEIREKYQFEPSTELNLIEREDGVLLQGRMYFPVGNTFYQSNGTDITNISWIHDQGSATIVVEDGPIDGYEKVVKINSTPGESVYWKKIPAAATMIVDMWIRIENAGPEVFWIWTADNRFEYSRGNIPFNLGMNGTTLFLNDGPSGPNMRGYILENVIDLETWTPIRIEFSASGADDYLKLYVNQELVHSSAAPSNLTPNTLNVDTASGSTPVYWDAMVIDTGEFFPPS